MKLWFCTLAGPLNAAGTGPTNGNTIVVQSDTDPTGHVQVDPATSLASNYVISAREYNPSTDLNMAGYVQDLGPEYVATPAPPVDDSANSN